MTPALRADLTRLRQAGFFIVCWSPTEVENVPKADLNDLEEQLIGLAETFISAYDEDEAPMCTACAGSGEGMYDGTRCSSCRGKGVEQHEQEREYDEA